MATPRFDLIDVVQTIRQRRRFVISVTVIAALLGAAFYLLKKKKYEAKTEFLVANPLYADRNNIFRTVDAKFVDYIGGDDDLDRVTVIGESDTVKMAVIRSQHLAEAYKIDTTKPKELQKLKELFKNSFDIKRTEYKDVILTYTDTDPLRAANVANASVQEIEQTFRGYYNNMRHDVCQSLQVKVNQLDSSINALTDTLAGLRNRYNVYDIISPARQNLIVSNVKSGAGAGMGIEEIQNVEATKDQLVTDKAKYISLLNEFSFGTKKDEMPLVQVLTKAEPPVKAKGPGAILTVIGCALLGFFFAVFYILITVYYRLLITAER